VTEYDGTPRAVIRTVALETRPLDRVDARFAWDEGEGDRTLADWLAAHTRWFERECERQGIPFSPSLSVVLERFELLYPFERALAVPDGPRIVPGYLPGAIGAIGRLHGAYYALEHGFGVLFESKVTREFAEFAARFDPAFDGMWFAVDRGDVHGSIVIDGHGASGTAHLRWFILGETLRGRGLGQRLLDTALGFCRRAGHRHVYLDTFKGLDAARALYEKAGFHLVAEESGQTWGRAVTEQRFEWPAPWSFRTGSAG
jgi:GNAT superfamily N-acetyltransferase